VVEDVVQDAFCRAVDLWAVRGVPENPAGWLMTTGRTLDVLRRERTARHFAPKLGRLPDSEWTRAAPVDESFADHVVCDEQLRMMFSCCSFRRLQRTDDRGASLFHEPLDGIREFVRQQVGDPDETTSYMADRKHLE